MCAYVRCACACVRACVCVCARALVCDSVYVCVRACVLWGGGGTNRVFVCMNERV